MKARPMQNALSFEIHVSIAIRAPRLDISSGLEKSDCSTYAAPSKNW